MPATFDAAITRDLAEVEEIDIETSSAPGRPTRRRTIWVVVADGQVYVRSVRGAAGRWYRDVRAHPRATLHVGNRALAVQAIPVGDPATIERVSEAFRSKYGRSPYMPPIVRDEVVNATLRLEPA
jgi:hypothetical protein